MLVIDIVDRFRQLLGDLVVFVGVQELDDIVDQVGNLTDDLGYVFRNADDHRRNDDNVQQAGDNIGVNREQAVDPLREKPGQAVHHESNEEEQQDKVEHVFKTIDCE